MKIVSSSILSRLLRLLPIVFCTLLITGCESETNMPELAQVNYAVITSDLTAHQLINMLEDPDDFLGRITVDLYFPNGVRPEAATLVVVKNRNNDNVKQIQPITQFPTTVEITGTLLKDLFGEDIELDDVFQIG